MGRQSLANTFEFNATYVTNAWQFPTNRFYEYGPEDEDWCRFFGIGRESEVSTTLTVPNAYIKDFLPDGTVVIGGYAKSDDWVLTTS